MEMLFPGGLLKPVSFSVYRVNVGRPPPSSGWRPPFAEHKPAFSPLTYMCKIQARTSSEALDLAVDKLGLQRNMRKYIAVEKDPIHVVNN